MGELRNKFSKAGKEAKERKYYTPTIKEFHVGFEYEYLKPKFKGDINWVPSTFDFTFNEPNDVFDTYNEGYEVTNLRVKYLDQEDIESLGFEEKNINRFDNNKGIIVGGGNHPQFYDIFNTIDQESTFSGIIKNKSELKKVLEMIGING